MQTSGSQMKWEGGANVAIKCDDYGGRVYIRFPLKRFGGEVVKYCFSSSSLEEGGVAKTKIFEGGRFRLVISVSITGRKRNVRPFTSLAAQQLANNQILKLLAHRAKSRNDENKWRKNVDFLTANVFYTPEVWHGYGQFAKQMKFVALFALKKKQWSRLHPRLIMSWWWLD